MSHAILSPSGASRWLACTPSARLEMKFPDKAGTAAAEGTLAHALAETMLRGKLKILIGKEYTAAIDKLINHDLYDHSMWEHCENYMTYVLEQYSDALSNTKDALIFLETKVDLTEYVPEGFGTIDIQIIADGVLDIIDLKYGKGVSVSGDKNKQMMLYALGALKEYDFMYDIHTVRMTIYQPRIDNYSTFGMSVTELRQWAQDELIPLAKLAFDGEGEFVPGSHCRFCKAAAVCKANAGYNLELAKYDFADSNLLSDDEISDILSRADRFQKWIDAVGEHALDLAVNAGKKWPGFKLVEGRSNRVISDEAVVVAKLNTAGFDESQIYNKKLKGITDMEKLLGKKDFAVYVSPLLIKPPGKPALVPESDKRPEYNSNASAAKDFAELVS